MKPARWVRGLLAAWLWAGAVGAAWAAAPALPALPTLPAMPVLHPIQVAEHAWYVQGVAAMGSPANGNFISNAGFVVTRDGVVVIDSLGSPALGQALLDAIHRITPQPVRYVIVTHYHADHIYGLQSFKAAGATIVAQTLGRNYLESDLAQRRLEASRHDLAPWIDAHTRLVPADRWLTDEVTHLSVGGWDFVLRHVGPAHTPEDLSVYVPALGVMYSGDLFFRGRIPYIGQADSRQWIASLDRLMRDHPKVVVPGHGPVSTDPAHDMQLTRDYLVFLRAAMAQAAENLEPFDDAYAHTDWSRFDQLPLFHAANRMNAYNTYLLLESQDGK